MTGDRELGTNRKVFVMRYTLVKYEGPNFYQSKDMANIKVFADKQTIQELYGPDLSMRGHKKQSNQSTDGRIQTVQSWFLLINHSFAFFSRNMNILI